MAKGLLRICKRIAFKLNHTSLPASLDCLKDTDSVLFHYPSFLKKVNARFHGCWNIRKTFIAHPLFSALAFWLFILFPVHFLNGSQIYRLITKRDGTTHCSTPFLYWFLFIFHPYFNIKFIYLKVLGVNSSFQSG